MEEKLIPIVTTLQERFNTGLVEFRGDVSLVVQPDQVVQLCTALRDEFYFEMLVEETAVDYWPQETPRFHLIYGLRSLRNNQILFLRVPLNGNSPTVPTLEGVYRNANWFERELWDMFGIRFDGHSDLRRIVLPADWEGHPLRKDFPLGYEEVQFSFNFDEIENRKPYARKDTPGKW